MSKKYTVKDFLKLTAPQKQRLYQNDREQYDRLAAAVKQNFDPEHDPEAMAMLATNPKTKSTLGKN